MPQRLAVFDPALWPGRSVQAKEQAWKVERRTWIDEFQATGLDPLVEAALAPDEPLLDPYSV